MAQAKANIEEHFVVVGLLEKVPRLIGPEKKCFIEMEVLHSS